MAIASWREMSEFEHFVQYYETDEFLVQSVGKFISTGLINGDATIILGTQAHRDGIEEHLKAEGLAVGVARARDRYISLDAATTLPQIMAGDSIDPVRFNKGIRDIIT